MKLIVGLGNPGPRYAGSRHNVGFMVVDELSRRWKVDVSKYDKDFEGQIGEGPIAGKRTLLLKPTTLMNLSGRSVGAVWRFYKLELADLLVAYDDLDLPVGQLRLRGVGSAGGHRGMNNVLLSLSSADVARARIGIGKVHRDATVEYVLGRFAPDEREAMESAISLAADAAECWLKDGIETAMNRFNKKPQAESRGDQDRSGGREGESS